MGKLFTYMALSDDETALVKMIRRVLSAAHTTPPEMIARMDVLPPRKREVVALMVRGATDRQIARELHLSLTTVRTHVRQILVAIGVDNRTALCAAYHGTAPYGFVPAPRREEVA